MAAEASRSGASADSYIGSLISLTSKFEIRYEGILYNINTEESSIGLHNVRSFGTEGRKKDGPQIPASDKIYEYILFRGSDIKDLQVKSSPPVQTAPMHNDPAIIQSHYSRPASMPTSLPSGGSGIITDLGPRTAQSGLPRSPFQGGLPLQQPGGSLGSWGSAPPPPTPDGPGLAVPLYWQGYYTPPGGLPHLQQPSLLRPPSGLPFPNSMQQPLQYHAINASLPSGSPNLAAFTPHVLQSVGSTPSLASTVFPSTLSHSQASSLAPDTTPSLPYKLPVTSLPAATLGANLPFVPPLTSSLDSISNLSQNMPSNVNKPSTVPGPTVAYQATSQSMPLIVGSSKPSEVEILEPLVTPGQLLQPGLPTFPSSQPLQTSIKVEVKPPEVETKSSLSEPSVLVPSEVKEPILPLPTPTAHKPNEAALQTHQGNRGRGRGRGNMYQRPETKFTEEFDFIAMNEKFKKDEVWGHLGKSKAQLRDREGEEYEPYDTPEEDDEESPKLEVKPVYVKEDFFDSLSSNALDSGIRSARPKFSDRLRMDTETFGDFQRHRGGWGGGRGFPGGRMRGSYYNRGYGYGGRGRGRSAANLDS